MANDMVTLFPETQAFAAPAPGAEAALCVRQLTKRFGSEEVLTEVSFAIEEGRSLALLGHSGSGKSTTLRLIAGLEAPDEGEIYLHGRRVEHLRARQRNVGVIFQQYALFPRMTVEDNIGFGLRIRGVKKRVRGEKIERLLALTSLAEHCDKYPWQLSGGQQQRVAIARALAYEPDVLLFDESFSALDPQTRVGLRREIRALLRELRVPALFITHDQEEAMELGDQIAILNRGRLEQIGTPEEVYYNPQTEFVATFLGAANVIEARVDGGLLDLGTESRLPRLAVRGAYGAEGETVKVVFRPEDVILGPPSYGAESHPHLGRGEIIDVAFAGATESLMVRLLRLGEARQGAHAYLAAPRYQTGSLQRSAAPGGVIIKVLRTKWEAHDLRLEPGMIVPVGLKNYKTLRD